MQYDTTLTTAQLDRMLDSIEPTWTLDTADHIETGHHTVYRLTADTPNGEQTGYLKATPPEKSPTVNLEARLLAGIDAHSDLPVPAVHGVVDEHDDLPVPFVLLAASPGESYSRLELPEVPDQRLRQIAYWCGRHLATLHDIPAVDSYGYLSQDGPPLRGETPPGDFSAIAVEGGADRWQECLDGWSKQTLSQLDETRFADVVPRVEPVLDSQIQRLRGPFEPVLARVDSSIENLLIEADGIGAAIDWEFTLAATRAYDISCVGWSLAGGPYLFDNETADRRPLVRKAVLEGYADTYEAEIRVQFHANRACYELLSTLRSMVHLEDWYQLFGLGARIDDASKQLREELDERVQDESGGTAPA